MPPCSLQGPLAELCREAPPTERQRESATLMVSRRATDWQKWTPNRTSCRLMLEVLGRLRRRDPPSAASEFLKPVQPRWMATCQLTAPGSGALPPEPDAVKSLLGAVAGLRSTDGLTRCCSQEDARAGGSIGVAAWTVGTGIVVTRGESLPLAPRVCGRRCKCRTCTGDHCTACHRDDCETLKSLLNSPCEKRPSELEVATLPTQVVERPEERRPHSGSPWMNCIQAVGNLGWM
jgi:hypothetical protein